MRATINSDPWLRIRSLPNLSAPVIGTVRHGTVVELQSITGAWGIVPASLDGIPLYDEANKPKQWYLNTQWLVLEQPPAPEGIAPVPWFSQVAGEGTEYANDCGPACWCMLAAHYGVRSTPAALARLMGTQNKYTTAPQAAACWRKLNLQTEIGEDILLAPFLCLVSYPKLTERYDGKFSGYHWIVVVGVDLDAAGNVTHVVFHDPLWPDVARGAYKRIEVNRFHEAEVSTASRARCWRG